MADYMKAQDLAEANQKGMMPGDLVQRGDSGALKTTSLIVAEKFGKDHANVLKALENLECSQEFRAVNFNASSYLSRQGKSLPMVEMTRDGFMFLAMGFTGREAAVWKERFIEAFNQMERYIGQSTAGMARVEYALAEFIAASHSGFRELNANLTFLSSDIGTVKQDVTELKSEVSELRSTVVDMTNRIAPRKEFSASHKRLFHLVVGRYYQNMCPCCQQTPVIGKDGRDLPTLRYEHWNGKSRNWLTDGWITCDKCNQILERDRIVHVHAFNLFQKRLREIEGAPTQLSMRLANG